MNFKAMARPITFGSKKPDDAGPSPLKVKREGIRRLASLQKAAEVLAVLPGPGESLHAIMTGQYDLAEMIHIMLTQIGPAQHIRIATLGYNGRNVATLTEWLQAKTVDRLTLLCSTFFKNNNPELFQDVLDLFDGKHRLAAGRNHCKVVCLAFRDGQKLVIEGSANLRTNSDQEQFAMFHDAELHDWHAAWIDEQVTKHEGEAKKASAKGSA